MLPDLRFPMYPKRPQLAPKGDGEAKLFAFAKTYSLNKGNAGAFINWLIKALAEISEVVMAYDTQVINVESTGFYFGYSMKLFDRVIWKLRA